MTASVKRPCVGDSAPDFELPADDHTDVSLASLRGQKFVLFFYPKADTSGCTLEAIAFSRLQEQFSESGVRLFGVSADPLKAQCKFRDKHELAMRLLSDESHALLNAYGIWVEKSMYGRKYMGIERTTVLIDEKGIIRARWDKVKPEGHAEAVLQKVQEL